MMDESPKCADCAHHIDDKNYIEGLCGVKLRSFDTTFIMPPDRKPRWGNQDSCGPDGAWFENKG